MNDYYKASNGLEAIDLIEAFNLNFSLGNVVKYVVRAGKKTDDAIEDLEKARWYLNREIERQSICPVCGSHLERYEGCYRCRKCNWRR